MLSPLVGNRYVVLPVCHYAEVWGDVKRDRVWLRMSGYVDESVDREAWLKPADVREGRPPLPPPKDGGSKGMPAEARQDGLPAPLCRRGGAQRWARRSPG